MEALLPIHYVVARGYSYILNTRYSRSKDIQLLEFVGGGGSGALVHKCLMNNTLCAVKILDVSSTPDSAIENFIKEIKLIESKINFFVSLLTENRS